MVVLSTSACEYRVKYLACPSFEPLTTAPVLDLNGTGEMKRLSPTQWLVTHKQVLAVKVYEKSCKERDADYRSVIGAVNQFNIDLEDLN